MHRSVTPKRKSVKLDFDPLRIVVLIISLPLLLTGCISASKTPNLERIFAQSRARTGKRPVIIIPGVLGTQLINSKTGEVVWPSVLRSTSDGSNLPITPNLAANRDDVVPGRIVETVRLAKVLPEVYVYRDLLNALRQYGGYREADWNNPGEHGERDTFYVFPYDWRRDNVENARLLATRIRELKVKLGHPELRFNILAHSMGGLIARYAAMYGEADLPADDVALKPTWAGGADINKIIMLGVPNEGSADAFTTIIDGYSITEGLRRRVPLLNKLTAEEAITAPSIFQLMPHQAVAKFLDEDLKPLAIDLYDPAMWKKYGWSPIYDSDYRRRFELGPKSAHSANSASNSSSKRSLVDLDGYLSAVLNRARRFHEALDAVSEREPPVVLLAIGGDCEETLSAPIILRDSRRERWLTLIRPQEFRTSTGAKVTRRQAVAAMFAPGDGRVTRRSLLGEDLPGARNNALFDSPLPLAYAIFGCDLHGELQKNKVLEDNALTALVNEAMR
jgi:pimeloyl-ACP methyl ester carboxylesterase